MTRLEFPPLESERVEIVERKGIGHPDTICDAIAEQTSINLSKFYLEEFGRIYHHNLDKAVLVGGRSNPAFGGGEMIQPIEIELVGRAILEVKGKTVPIWEIFERTVMEWFQENVPNVDVHNWNHLSIDLNVRPGSKDLVTLYDIAFEKGIPPEANDTSFGVGFAPFTQLENIVMKVENTLNSRDFKKKHPYLGEDIKVMGVRIEDNIRITVAAAFVDKYVDNLQDYLEKKERIKEHVFNIASSLTDRPVEVFVNTADIPEKESVYITVTGTSAESGDDGQVGRGNRVNGLITPYRPMSLEAPAGKNPISHVGKLYNILANEVAKKVVESLEEVEEAYVYVVSQIGKPITEPQAMDVKVRLKKEVRGIQEEIEKLSREELENVTEYWKRILKGEITVY